MIYIFFLRLFLALVKKLFCGKYKEEHSDGQAHANRVEHKSAA